MWLFLYHLYHVTLYSSFTFAFFFFFYIVSPSPSVLLPQLPPTPPPLNYLDTPQRTLIQALHTVSHVFYFVSLLLPFLAFPFYLSFAPFPPILIVAPPTRLLFIFQLFFSSFLLSFPSSISPFIPFILYRLISRNSNTVDWDIRYV